MPLFDELRHIPKSLRNLVRGSDRNLHRSLAIVKLYRSVAPFIGSDDAEWVVLGPMEMRHRRPLQGENDRSCLEFLPEHSSSESDWERVHSDFAGRPWFKA
jgi:hypothetical protein